MGTKKTTLLFRAETETTGISRMSEWQMRPSKVFEKATFKFAPFTCVSCGSHDSVNDCALRSGDALGKSCALKDSAVSPWRSLPSDMHLLE